MANQFIICVEQLKSAFGDQDPRKASILIEEISQYFDDRISATEIDLAIDKAFNADAGILSFLQLSINCNKLFKSENVKILKLYVKIIQLHEKKIIPYAVNIVNICLQYINSFQITTAERTSAVLAIKELVDKKLCESVNKNELLTNLLRVLHAKKPLATLMQCIFELIGSLAKYYSDCIRDSNKAIPIRNMYFKALEDILLNQHDIQYAALIGAINGLRNFLIAFPPSTEDKPDVSQRLYTCIKKLSDPPDESNQRGVYRCALCLLTEHSHLFAEHLFTDYMYWHKLLLNKWMNLPWEDRKTAIFLLHAFHKELAVQLTESRNPNESEEMLKFFIVFFKKTLELATSQPYEIRIAIRGFGLMAAPCKAHLSPDYLKELLLLVMQRTEIAANTISAKDKDSLEHFPDYVQALSQIMEFINELSGIQLSTLRNIIISLFRHFHLLSKAHHEITVNSLMHTFHNLLRLGDTILDDILEKVLLQGVIWTCSHKLPFDAQNDWEHATNWKDQITFKSYLPLWNGLLIDTEISSFNRPLIVCKIYDHMMKTLFNLLQKLDLTTKRRIYRDEFGNDQELFFCDPNYDLEPKRPKDFHLFFNLVDFYRDILKAQPMISHREKFSKWINQFIETIILMSIQYPLISGYLKLMQTALSITGRLNYFDNDMFEQNEQIYTNLLCYLKSTVAKAQQSCGELQLACLKLLFSAPAVMLKDFMIDTIPAFVIAFDIGKWNLNLFIADMALSAIERYMSVKSKTSEEVQTLLKTLLPCLDPYLQGFTNDFNSIIEISRNRSGKSTRKLVKVTETDLSKFQKRIILFLGKLEPDQCLYLVRNDHSKLNLVKWDASLQTISLTLFGPNLNPKIYLDTIMPRICEIAVSANDRQKKMAACEIVHALILYLIGMNNHRGKLWSELCERMLQLGCDGDIAVQQMFEPLIVQTMHYMSHKDQLNHDGVDILLHCLMEAMSHQTNAAVRDLAARSLREFVVWTIKQSTPEQMAGSPFNIITLIEKISLFSFDSMEERRFAAALAFNNLYRVLREEESIIDIHWLNLLHTFSVNFIMCEEYGKRNANSEPILEQVSGSLDHIVRVLKEKKNLFNKLNEHRIVPSVFKGGLLKDAVLWVLKQCNSPQLNYRHKMMEIFTKLSISVDKYNSTVAFFRDAQTNRSILELCEGNHNGTGIAARPDLKHIGKAQQTPLLLIYSWLESLLTSLDCYVWIFGDCLLSDTQKIMEKSCIFTVVRYYLENVCDAAPINLIALVSPASNSSDESENSIDYEFGIEVIDKINTIKCRILLRIIDLFIKLLATSSKQIPISFWDSNEAFYRIITTALFEPQTLQFDLKNPEMQLKLPHRLESLILAIHRNGPLSFKNEFYKELSTTVANQYKDMSDSAQAILSSGSITTNRLDRLRGIELIYRLLQINNIKFTDRLKQFFDITASKILYALFGGVHEQVLNDLYAIAPTPDALRFSNNLMRISCYKTNIHQELIDLILNATNLKVQHSSTVIKQGKYFFDLYKIPILEYFLKTVDIIVERFICRITVQNILFILRILIELCEYAYKHQCNDKNQMKLLSNALLSNWSLLLLNSENFEGTTITLQLIELMTHIAMICPHELAEISQKAQDFEPWLLKIISNRENRLELKSQAIFLLPCIVGASTVKHLSVQKTLELFQANHFPLHLSEFRAGSINETIFMNTLQTILDTLCASKSPVILKFVINCTSADAKHIMEYQIHKSLEKFIRQFHSSDQQLICLNISYDCFADRTLEPSVRLTILRRFLLTTIRASSIETILAFYTNHIKEVSKWCDTIYGVEMNDWSLEQALATRIGAFELLETMIGIVPKETITDKSCSIGIALLGADKITTEGGIIRTLTKKAFTVRTEVFSTSNRAHMELFRKYQCAAYKALCAFVSNTQNDLRFYQSFLFKEDVWTNLIDISNDNLYTDLPQEVDTDPKLKERIVSIRRLKETQNSNNNRIQPKYLDTQIVFNSSLSQDVTKIDLSFSAVRTPTEVAANEWSTETSNTFVLEKNSINDHEIMASLCAVIQHMFENEITPISDVATAGVRRVAPKWVDCLCKVIENDRIHKNIRIFLAILMDNCRQWFRSYAPTITKSILKLLVSECYGKTIDAFVIFMVVNLLEWDSVYKIQTDDEINLAGDLIKILMEHAWHERKDVFKKNLELIKSLVEIWRESISPPRQLLFDSIRRSNDAESRANICGIQLNAIILANNLIPWTDTTQTLYVRSLAACLDNKNTSVYQPASQVLGMALNQIIAKQQTLQQSVQEFLDGIVTRLESIRKVNEKKFCDIIYGIHKHYEQIVDTFLTRITSYIPCAAGVLKRIYLEMFLSRITIYENNVYREVATINIKDLLRSNEFQLLALHIINKILSKMTETEVRAILPDICAFVDSKYSDCRDVMYEIMIYIRRNFKDKEIHKATSTVLLSGLNDIDHNLQKNIFNFWSNEDELPAKLSERFVKLFHELYNPNAEQHFLSNCAQLLLEPAINSADSKKQILQHRNESDRKFTEYEVNTNWKTQNSLLRAPLFMESQQKQIISGEIAPTQNYLRATVNTMGFSPTLEPSAFHQTISSFALQTQSSLLFSVQPQILDRRSQRVDGGGVGSILAERSNTLQKPNTSNKYERLRARILRDKDQLSRSLALNAIERNEYTNVMRSQQQKSKEMRVTLYRRYRFGEYPDFLINSLALLMPLQALIKYDAILARQVLVAIFNGICEELGPDNRIFMISISECICDIFGETKTTDSVLFSALIEIALTNPTVFNIDSDTLSTISTRNNMMANGILLLESHLNEKFATERLHRSSTMSLDKECQHWLKLVNMYYALSEYDIAASIFADKLETDRRLPKAIEYESNGDYPSAHELYAKIVAEANDSRAVESDFAYQSYYNCYVNMGRWSDLDITIADQIEHDEEFWNDNWNQKNLLPHYVSSKLRLLLSGAATNLDFVNNMQQWLRTTDRADYIKLHFAEELMMLHIANEDYLQARLYSEKYFDRFLNDWQNISVLSDKMRINKILDLRKVAEINKYSELLLSTDINRTVLQEFVGRWNGTQMQKTDSLKMWDSLICYRRFICALVAKSIDRNDSISTIATNKLTESVFDMHFKLVDIALKQNNIELSNTIIRQIKGQILENSFDKRSAQLNIANGKYLQLRSQQRNLNKPESLSMLLDAWHQIDQAIAKHQTILEINPDIHINALEHLTDIAGLAFDNISKLTNIDAELSQRIIDCTEPSDKQNLHERIYDWSYRCHKQSINLAEKCEQSMNRVFTANFSIKLNGMGESYNRMALFCQEYYGNEKLHRSIETEQMIITSVLRGMQFNSKNARFQFPRILQLPALKKMILSDAFNEEMSNVPEWMFLDWIPQVLSNFSFSAPCFLDELVLRLATTYPAAMIYAFQLSYTQYSEKYPNRQPRAIVQQILDLLHNPIVEKFINAINCLNLPEKFIITHFTDILLSMQKNQNYTNEMYQNHLLRVQRAVFSNDMRGIIVQKVGWLDKVITNLIQLNVEDNRENVAQILNDSVRDLNKFNSMPSFVTPKLDIFCSWLSQFHWCFGDNYIELPGQYTSERRPNIERHAKIIKFGRNVEIFKTLRKPIKITILCSDGKSYDFLVKYGEDLRQDERIQQMLSLMSEQLAADKNCRQQNLSLQTYKVIPINSYCGLLSWVKNTVSMESFLEHYTPQLNVKELIDDFTRFIKIASKNLPNDKNLLYVFYAEAAAHYTPDQIAANFEMVGRKLPVGILRNALFTISSSPESFFVLRNNFAASLATMCIANWILGIGDRHLNNLLINKKNGKMVGIDFGLAFGAATRDLPIPELMPFRLTPHIVSAASPFETSGLIQKCMIHTLNAFRANHKLIMACLEVFVNEPKIDWLQSLNRNATDSGESIDSQWEPKQHINVVNKKLLGANPLNLIANDLNGGYISKYQKYLDGYLRILRGTHSNIRTNLAATELSTVEQVACLIEIATDPGILGITYAPYAPWI